MVKRKYPRKEARIIGIDDEPFNKFKDKQVLIIGTIYRGGNYMDGLLSTKVRVDGKDSADRIIKMINKSKFKTQLRCIMLDGVAVGGFNVIDLNKLNEKTKIPVIAVIRNFPDFKKIFSALKKIKKEEKIKLIEQLPEPVKIGKIYIQPVGLDLEEAKRFLKISCTNSYIPEPIRIAHLIAAGIVKGESRGRA